LAYEQMARAELARARALGDEKTWQAAGERFAALGYTYHAAYAWMRVGEALALGGAPARQIAEPLRAAHAAALNLGVRPFRGEVEELARRTGVALASVDRPGRKLTDDLGLTERELEVLALVAEGRSNREIARELFITSKTASAHVSHILMKLGVPNRAGAAAAAHRLGLTREHASSS
jgi:DNA-binding CsgD family transcriptional regulator